MDQSRGAPQEVPAEHAAQLRALLDTDDALLNALLAAYRSQGWRTATLAATLNMNPPAVSKRIERARARTAHGAQLAAAAPAEDPAEESARRDRVVEHERITAAVAACAIPAVPAEPRVRTTISGRHLAAEKIAELKEMRRASSRVNGALPAEHPARRISEAFAAELYRLITEEGFSAYYLSRVLGEDGKPLTHRAIASRLERHGYRDPCPSVAGTSSGVYLGRKIGDPGAGVLRLEHPQRTELRRLWAAAHDEDPEIAAAGRKLLAAELHRYQARGFTVANLAQALSSKRTRVSTTEVRTALDAPAGRAGEQANA